MRPALPFGGNGAARWSWRIRRRLRSPVLYWSAAVAVGLLTASTVARVLDSADAQRARYGHWVAAAVAVRDRPAGAELGPEDVDVVRLPAAMVPQTAWRSPPVGRRLLVAVTAGEVLVRGRTRHAASANAAQLGPDHRGVAIPVGEPALEVRSGDRVDVVALDGESGRYLAVAESVAVIAAEPGLVTVAVERDDVGAVMSAVVSGTAQLALRGA